MGVYGPQFQPNTNRVGKDTRLPKAPGVPKLPKVSGTLPRGSGGAPQQTGPTPGTQPGSQGNGLDSTYLGNTALHTFNTNSQIGGLRLQGSQAGTSLQGTLARLAYQQPRQQLALEQRANQMGALYSTPYDQSAGDLSYQFLGKEGAARAGYTRTMDTIAGKIAGLRGGDVLYDRAQAAQSIGRSSNAAAKNPALGGGLAKKLSGRRGVSAKSFL